MVETKTIKYPSGVVLNRTFDDSNETWEIKNDALSYASFTLDMSKCKNCSFDDGSHELVKTIKVNPGETDNSLKVVKKLPWSFSVSFRLVEEPLSYEQQKKIADKKNDEWNDKADETADVFKSIPYEVLDYDDIVKKMKQKGIKNFIDPDFPPKEISKY